MTNKDKLKFWQHIRKTASATGVFDKKLYTKVGHCTYWLGKKVIIFMTEPLEPNVYQNGCNPQVTKKLYH